MNQGNLVDVVSEKAEISKKEADAIVTITIETIMEAVSRGEKVPLSASVILKHTAIRLGRGEILKRVRL